MAIPNGLNPKLYSLGFRSGTAIITGGVATGTTAITADVGTPGNGSIYIRGAGAGEIWVMVSGTWTQLTIN